MVDGDAAAAPAAAPAAPAAAPAADAAPAAAAPAAEAAPAAAAPAEGARVRRARGEAAKETIQDELAQETRRNTLLDAVEHQLKNVATRGRLVLACNLPEDKKAIAQIEEEFGAWVKKTEQAAADAAEEDGTGAPPAFGGIFIQQPGQAIHYLEGTTESLFAGLKLFASFGNEVPAGGDTPGRGALISNLRIIYFTEVHGVQTVHGWHPFQHTSAKSMGGPQLLQDEESCYQAVFMCYRKILVVNCKIMEATGGNANAVKDQLKKLQDGLPSLDELTVLLHKTSTEYFFTYAEFEKAFCAPFHLVLQSELLWPMPPPLSY